MPLRSRPLFLVPSLMHRSEVEAVLVDVGAGADRVGSPTAKGAAVLLAELEPLIVEANVAGYEVVALAATAGPDGAAPCLYLNIESYLIDSAFPHWDDAVPGIGIDWPTVTAALALRFLPRLAMREEVGSEGSVLSSSYGIPFPSPASWLGTVDADRGGWLVATTNDRVALPDELSAIAGRVKDPRTSAGELRGAIRSAAAERWDRHGRGAEQLSRCALAPLFDPSAWRLPAGDVGVELLGEFVRGSFWEASSRPPGYAELVDSSLFRLLSDRTGEAAAYEALRSIRGPLRGELLRRSVVDPETVSEVVEARLGPRFDAAYAELQRFGQVPWPVDLFRLLELGLLSLERRVPEEESLPAVMEREWTDPVLTGRYDQTGDEPAILGSALADEATSRAMLDLVAGAAGTVVINQAGDRVEGFWHERELDPGLSPGGGPARPGGPGGPVSIRTWSISGEREPDTPGLVFAVELTGQGAGRPGVLRFMSADGRTELESEWEGQTRAFRRRLDSSRIVARAHEGTITPPRELVTPHLNDVQLEALNVNPGVRELVEADERFWLHPAEVALLQAIVDTTVWFLDREAEADTPFKGLSLITLGAQFVNGFRYFRRDEAASRHLELARMYIRLQLHDRETGGTPLGQVIGGPPTYWHGLGLRLDEIQRFSAEMVDGLGADPAPPGPSADEYEYRWKFSSHRTGPSSAPDRFALLGDAEAAAARGLLTSAGPFALTQFEDIWFGIRLDPELDAIAVEIRKVQHWPGTDDWPGIGGSGESVHYDGILYGLGLSPAHGLDIDGGSPWSTVQAMLGPWRQADFEGPAAILGIPWGWGLADQSVLEELPAGPVWDVRGESLFRVAGEVSCVRFVNSAKPDVWSLLISFTNSWGAHVAAGGNATAARLWLRQGARSSVEPAELVDLGVLHAVAPAGADVNSFLVGRSELTPEGEVLLRSVAARHLNELASPSTTMKVEGHASPNDARELYNQTLSERRAANVIRYLRSFLGPLFAVAPERTLTRGLGDRQARAALADDPGGNPEQWRRVDVFVNGTLVMRTVAL